MTRGNTLSRRRLLRLGLMGGVGIAALAGCGETQVVEREVVTVVTQEVPVERIVTQVVEKQVPVEVEKVVIREVEKGRCSRKDRYQDR